jgi:hypothetical protein
MIIVQELARTEAAPFQTSTARPIGFLLRLSHRGLIVETFQDGGYTLHSE